MGAQLSALFIARVLQAPPAHCSVATVVGGGGTWGQPGDSEVGDGSVRNGAERGLGKEGSAGREVAVPWWGRSFGGKHP